MKLDTKRTRIQKEIVRRCGTTFCYQIREIYTDSGKTKKILLNGEAESREAAELECNGAMKYLAKQQNWKLRDVSYSLFEPSNHN